MKRLLILLLVPILTFVGCSTDEGDLEDLNNPRTVLAKHMDDSTSVGIIVIEGIKRFGDNSILTYTTETELGMALYYTYDTGDTLGNWSQVDIGDVEVEVLEVPEPEEEVIDSIFIY